MIEIIFFFVLGMWGWFLWDVVEMVWMVRVYDVIEKKKYGFCFDFFNLI